MQPDVIYNEAVTAAKEAFANCKPAPMIVGQAKGLFGNEMVAGTEEFVPDGVCGFAWVHIDPARGKFVNYCKNNNIGSKGVYRGYSISMGMIDPSSQSMQRKEAAGAAFANVLVNHGISAYMHSRMD